MEGRTMLEYEIQPHTRRCAATGRELQPGEKYYCVLVEEQGRLVRHDYASESWQGSPEGAFGFWTGRVPGKTQPRKLRVDAHVLLDCFERLDVGETSEKVNFRYVLALLLIRSKKLQFLQSDVRDGQEIIQLRCQRSGTRYDVINPRLGEDELAAVQEQVLQVVGWD